MCEDIEDKVLTHCFCGMPIVGWNHLGHPLTHTIWHGPETEGTFDAADTNELINKITVWLNEVVHV